MKPLKGTKTHDNLKAAFAGESQANRRYLYFANKADVEGQNDVAALFRSTAEGETGHVVTDGTGRVRSFPEGYAQRLLAPPIVKTHGGSVVPTETAPE